MTKDCRETALSYLEHRERSAHEVKSHLAAKGFQEEEIEEALKHLQEFRYVDDARYCGDYIRYGMGKGRGPIRLQHELAEKGIDASLIREALEESFDRETERNAAMKEAKKLLKTGGARPDEEPDEMSADEETKPDEKALAKIGRKLTSLGYRTEVIFDIIGRLRKS